MKGSVERFKKWTTHRSGQSHRSNPLFTLLKVGLNQLIFILIARLYLDRLVVADGERFVLIFLFQIAANVLAAFVAYLGYIWIVGGSRSYRDLTRHDFEQKLKTTLNAFGNALLIFFVVEQVLIDIAENYLQQYILFVTVDLLMWLAVYRITQWAVN